MVLFVRFDCCYRTCKVVFTSYTVTDNNYFIQYCIVFLQCNHQVSSSFYSSILVADIRYSDVSTLISLQCEVTVEVGDGSRLCTYYAYGSTDDGLALSILHMAFHVDLRKGSYRKEES